MSIMVVILLMLLSNVIGAFGAFFLKKGAAKFNLRLDVKVISEIARNWQIILGIALYVLGTVFFIYLLRTEKLSLIYPMTALSYIFATMLSVTLLKEKFNAYKFAGMALVVIGVVLVTL